MVELNKESRGTVVEDYGTITPLCDLMGVRYKLSTHHRTRNPVLTSAGSVGGFLL